ncbi:MAG: endonuclease/exonuclease/phosphatase family protein, partial [Armatimonadetes bacterium]|nr:endonuclease/exonuclease/phosphatase family protein [Armatimonadota bacterium]
MERGGGFRVVSLNCAGGSFLAASEVARYKPDIVLFQESPARKEVEVLARKLFGSRCSFVWGIDASVISRWPAERVAMPRTLLPYCAMARVTLPSRKRVDCVSVRLAPPVFRLDPWRLDCWKAYAADRRNRRKQVAAIMNYLRSKDAGAPLVVGGDMNSPGGDAALSDFQGMLRDAFNEAGRGFCNTVLNDYPVLRFDQVWICNKLKA